MDEFNEQQAALQRIVHDARRLTKSFQPPSPLAIELPHKLPLGHHFTLAMPQHITSILLDRGLPISLAEKMNETFLHKVSAFKRFCETQYFQALKESLHLGASHVYDSDRFVAAVQSTLTSRYNKCLKDWQSKLETYTRRQSSSRNRPAPTAVETRPIFKNESVPILEEAFNLNAYPNRADKETLAEETKMEYKQVNIWFQNRRARSKREGVSLQRTAIFVTHLHPPRHSTSLSPEPCLADGSDDETFNRASESRIFCDVPCQSVDLFMLNGRPTHAFPTPYPPLSDEAFPVRSGRGFFEIPWLRKCVTDVVKIPSVDIEQLTTKMASLSLASGASSSYKSLLPSFTLVPPPAPLPALIRTATASSRVRPVASLVSAAGSPSIIPKDPRRLYQFTLPPHPPRFWVGKPGDPCPSFPASSTPSRPIRRSRNSVTGRSRRSETRSPSSPHSSRSSSLSSVTSSRSTSSSRSVASSIGPLTPPSTSPRIEAFTFTKEESHVPHVHHSSSIFGGGHVFSPSR